MEQCKPIVVIGVGYVGITSAIHFAKIDIPVIAYDTDPKIVSAINEGRPRGQEFLSYLHPDLHDLLLKNLLKATTNPADLTGVDTFIIADRKSVV